MECAICLENFVLPRTNEDLDRWYNEKCKTKDSIERKKLENLLITKTHNQTHACPNPSCTCLICGDCWRTITNNGQGGSTEYFVCPYCRHIDWKYSMIIVLVELQRTVLGYEKYNEILLRKFFPQLDE
jgi:hypothetical protein